MSNKVFPFSAEIKQHKELQYFRGFSNDDTDDSRHGYKVPKYSRVFSVDGTENIRMNQYWACPVQEGTKYDQIEPTAKTDQFSVEIDRKGPTGDSTRVLRTFVETSSVKGLPKVFKSPSLFQKALWMVCLIIGVGIGVSQLWLLFTQYLAFATVVTTTEVNESPMFPDISICNLNPIPTDMPVSLTYDDYIALIQYYGLPLVFEDPDNIIWGNLTDIQHYMWVYQYSSEGYFQNIPTEDDIYLEQVKNSFVLDCVWQPWDHVSNNDPIPCDNASDTHVTYFYNHHYGPCFTFQIPSSKRARDVASFSVMLYLEDRTFLHQYDIKPTADWSFASGARVKVHSRGTLPNMARAITAAPGHETTVWVDQEQRTRLEEPWGQCFGNKRLPMDHRFAYELDACRSLCMQQNVINECDCLTNKHLMTPAMREENLFCPHMNYTDYNWTYDRILCAQQALLQDVSCGCKQACSETRNNIQVSQAPWPHETHYFWFYQAYIRYRVWDWDRFQDYDYLHYAHTYEDLDSFDTDLVKRNFLQVNVNMKEFGYDTVSTTEKMPFVNLTGALGGILNLWIGITFVTFIEVFDLIYQLIVAKCKKREKQSTEPGVWGTVVR